MTNFINKDNEKVMKILYQLIPIYQRSIRKLKLKYLNKFRFKACKRSLIYYQKHGLTYKNSNIYEKLYKEYQDLIYKKDELNHKYDIEEAKKYPFTPKINNILFNYPKSKYINSISISSKSPKSRYDNDNENENEYDYCLNNYSQSHNRNHGISLGDSQSLKYNSLKNLHYRDDIENCSPIKKYNRLTLYNDAKSNYRLTKLTKPKIKKESKKTPDFLRPTYYLNKENHSVSLTANKRNNKNTQIKKNSNKRNEKPKLEKRKNSQNSNLQINLSDYNSINSFSSPNVTDNLSVLFSTRLYKEKIDYKNNKKAKNTILNLHKRSQKSLAENSTSTNICEKGTNYYSEKQSGTEQFSNLNLESFQNKKEKKTNNNNQNKNIKNQKQRDFFYTFKTGKIPYNSIYLSKSNIPQSISSKSTNFLSPRYDSQTNYERNKSQRISSQNIINNNIDFDFSNDESYKKLSTQNSKTKNIDDSYGKNHIFKNIEISSGVVNECVINNLVNNNLISRRSSHVSLQTISDSKLFEMANYYVTTDDSFEKYMAMRGNFRRINKPKSSSIK